MGKGVGYVFICLFAGLSACAPPAAQVTEEPSLIQAYFTDPESPIAQFALGGPDEDLQTAIENARVSIDVAIYDVNLYSIRDALIAAAKKGVQVRMVVESDNFDEEQMSVYLNAGIEIIGDEDPDSMHNKFLVIDRYEVWTGSMNYTLTDAYGNRNNMVRLLSNELAQNYEAEFDEMFKLGLFGAHSPANTPNREVSIDGIFVENYFAPEDRVLPRLIALLNGAEESIYFLTYSLTTDELADAILAAKARGVEVYGVMDKAQAANQGGEYERLVQDAVEVHLDGEDGCLHNKVIVIDGEIVVTGSYNFSANAEERNDENLLVIHDAGIASKYLEEFQKIWNLAIP